MKYLILFVCLWTAPLFGQNRAFYLLLGSPIGTLGESTQQLKPKPGLLLGADYWVTNAKGNSWSMGLDYQFFSRKKGQQKETFEYLTIRAMPIIWNLGEKKAGYFALGIFGNYLLHQEFKDGGSVVNSTKLIQRTYVGPSVGVGVRLGEEGKSRILMGLRDDFGLLGFGNGSSLKFNTISLCAGINI